MPHCPASHSALTGSSMSGGSGCGLGQAARNVLDFGSGMTRAKGLPRLRTCTTSPAANHLEIRLNSFRRSRTVAVFIVIHMYHKMAYRIKGVVPRGVWESQQSLRVGALGLLCLFVFRDPGRFLAFEKCLHTCLAFFAGAGSRDGIGSEFKRAFKRARGDSENQFFGRGDRFRSRSQDLRNFGIDECIEGEFVSRNVLNEPDIQCNRSKEPF